MLFSSVLIAFASLSSCALAAVTGGAHAASNKSLKSAKEILQGTVSNKSYNATMAKKKKGHRRHHSSSSSSSSVTSSTEWSWEFSDSSSCSRSGKHKELYSIKRHGKKGGRHGHGKKNRCTSSSDDCKKKGPIVIDKCAEIQRVLYCLHKCKVPKWVLRKYGCCKKPLKCCCE